MYSSLVLKPGKFFVDNLQDYTKFSIQHKIRTSKEKEIPSKLNTYFTAEWLNQYKKMRDTKWKEENNWKVLQKVHDLLFNPTNPEASRNFNKAQQHQDPTGLACSQERYLQVIVIVPHELNRSRSYLSVTSSSMFFT